jgi:hypothetical protein
MDYLGIPPLPRSSGIYLVDEKADFLVIFGFATTSQPCGVLWDRFLGGMHVLAM